MATYRYEPLKPTKCEHCQDGFEFNQPMADAPLTKCPECGAEVQRVITPVSINKRPSDKSVLSTSNLKKHGFKRLEKTDNGYVDTTG